MRLRAMSWVVVGWLRPLKMSNVKRLACVAAATATLALACGTHAAGLFLPAQAATQRGLSATTDMRERPVRIAREELSAVLDDIESAGTGRLLLNVADGARLDVVLERTAPTKWGYSLSGRVAGGAGGYVTLVVHEESVAGSIWTPDFEYELIYLGDGTHALRNVTNAPPLKCDGAPLSELPAAAIPARGGTDNVVVDILVLWTPLGAQRSFNEYGGGQPRMLAGIDALVARTNHALERSGAFVTLNLVGAERVDYVELGTSTDLRRLTDPDDGYIDNIPVRRDALGADLVYLLRGLGGGQARGAFMVGEGDPFLFSHEVGHTFGIAHNRLDQTIGFAGYKHGFTTEACQVTIMSYVTECGRKSTRIPFYASPWRYSLGDGRALGVTRFSRVRGGRGPADAVLTLNRNRHRVASYRPSRKAE